MSWYISHEHICSKCKNTYVEEVNTLTIARKDLWKCSMCGGDVIPLNNKKDNNKFIEKLRMVY